MTIAQYETDTVIRRGPVRLPPTATVVSDADEEVFLLYTNLAARSRSDEDSVFRGLGYIDSHKDILTVEFSIDRKSQEDEADSSAGVHSHRSGRSRKKKGGVASLPQDMVISIELVQDKTALWSRKGDTGSIVWRASFDFAQYLLQGYYTRTSDALLDPDMSPMAHVLELGAGTGLLGIALSPIVARYTLTDVEALVPLIQKNVAHNRNLPSLPRSSVARRRSTHGTGGSASKEQGTNIVIEALDWEVLCGASPSLRRASFQYPPIDLLLAVDCIYHPSLLPALLATIDHLATPGVTAALVVVELRAEDVVREFLAGWLSLSNGAWQLWSIPNLLDGPYAVWVGWKSRGERIDRME